MNEKRKAELAVPGSADLYAGAVVLRHYRLFLAGERLSPQAYLGAALMFVSLLLMQVDLGKKASATK